MLSQLLKSPQTKSHAVHAVGAVVGIAFTLGFYQYFYAAWGSDIEYSSMRIEQLTKLVATSDKVAADHHELVERTETLTAAVAATSSRMPATGSAADFIDRATQLAHTLRMSVTQFATGSPYSTPSLASVEVTCRVSGSFASTCRYLSAIEQFPQIAKVSRLDIKTAGNSSAYPVQLTFQLYYRPELHDTEKERSPL